MDSETRSSVSLEDQGSLQNTNRPARFWCNASLWAALILTAMIHGARIEQHSLRGEEPRRGLVATEMLRSGDWIVPRQQGTLFLSRPPLQNWIIAATGSVLGEIDRLAIRLPSLIALLMTVAMIYGYSRFWLSPGGAMLACLSYATMGQVLELGYLGETESMYTLIVAGSILGWHRIWVSPKNQPSKKTQTLAWCAGYSLAAAGMLAKGYQGPVYFLAAVGMYLIVSRQWKRLITPAHLTGLLCFFVIWNAWNIPFLIATGWENTIAMYHNDVAMRFEHQTWQSWAEHLVSFPIEIGVCMLPWSLLLAVLMMPRFWRGAGRYREPLMLTIAAIAITFPSVWFTPGAHGRYYMPLYPCFAILIAIATEKVFRESWLLETRKCGGRLAGFSKGLYAGAWRRYQRGFALVMLALAAVILSGAYLENTSRIFHSMSMKWLVVGSLLAVAAGVFRLANQGSSARLTHAVFLTTLGIGVVYVGVVSELTLASTNDARPLIANAKSCIPAGHRLESVGVIDHLFALHYGEAIPVTKSIQPSADLRQTESYICYNTGHSPTISPGVRLETIAVINCKRSKKSNRSRQVTVAKCVWDTAYLASLRNPGIPSQSKNR